MKRNVIVLTSGLTGSSVLTGLISRAGYWMGDHTHKKKDYDTYENRELIDLNLRIFNESGYDGNYLTEFSSDAISKIGALGEGSDSDVYRRFVEKCAAHQPWIWKDPRLWLTIRFWQRFLDLKSCKFIVLTRGYGQLWVSTTLRRQIVAYKDSKSYEQRVTSSSVEFLENNQLPYLRVRYEDLILRPAETLSALNGFLETSLTIDDLKSIYHKPLYKNPGSSWVDVAKAVLIYIKNYSERIDVDHGKRSMDKLKA